MSDECKDILLLFSGALVSYNGTLASEMFQGHKDCKNQGNSMKEAKCVIPSKQESPIII